MMSSWLMAHGSSLVGSLPVDRLLRATSNELRVFSYELSQHIRQNAAVAECDELLRGIDARDRLKFDDTIALAIRANGDRSAGLEALRDSDELVSLAPGQLQ